MKILIAGGSGFLGRALTRVLVLNGHQVWILTRGAHAGPDARAINWDGKSDSGWGGLVNEVDAVVNLCGKSLAAWPWTPGTRRAFLDSRIRPGLALAQAIRKADRPPRVFVQASGINYYGLAGIPADESTPPGDDFLARLTVEWENSTSSVEERGVRRVITRSALVLDAHGGLLPLMALPVRLFLGGPLAGGEQAMPWIHLADETGALRFLIENDQAHGPFNLIAPSPTSSAKFTRSLAEVLHRPYWFPFTRILLRTVLGGMSDLVAEGRVSHPRRLAALGYQFQFEHPKDALADLYR
jgi:uncharacterized protein (TIGR01777 family)